MKKSYPGTSAVRCRGGWLTASPSVRMSVRNVTPSADARFRGDNLMCVPASTALQELPERLALLVFKSAGKKEQRTRSPFHAAIRLVSSCRATLHRELLLSVLRSAVCGANCCPHALSSIVRRNIRTGTGLCARTRGYYGPPGAARKSHYGKRLPLSLRRHLRRRL